MCYERYLRRRDEEARESQELWSDFERTRPVPDSEETVELAGPAPAEAREELATPER